MIETIILFFFLVFVFWILCDLHFYIQSRNSQYLLAGLDEITRLNPFIKNGIWQNPDVDLDAELKKWELRLEQFKEVERAFFGTPNSFLATIRPWRTPYNVYKHRNFDWLVNKRSKGNGK